MAPSLLMALSSAHCEQHIIELLALSLAANQSSRATQWGEGDQGKAVEPLGPLLSMNPTPSPAA